MATFDLQMCMEMLYCSVKLCDSCLFYETPTEMPDVCVKLITSLILMYQEHFDLRPH